MLPKKHHERAEKARKRISESISKLHLLKNNPKGPKSTTAAIQPLTPATTTTAMTSLRISVTARFEHPLDMKFHQSYEVSPDFVVTDEVCNALVKHVDHCSNELITRTDDNAGEPLTTGDPPSTKLARFHLIFRVEREGLAWKEKVFTSFHGRPQTIDGAYEIVLEIDRMIASFLIRHDQGFHWKIPSLVDQDPMKHKSSHPEVGIPQSLSCVPTYRGQPGYSIHLTIRTCVAGRSRDWSLHVHSNQPTPLTLQLGEGLMSQLTAILRHAFREEEMHFAEKHKTCDGLEGTARCRHFEENAFDMIVKVQNNLGPDYNHLCDRFQTFRHLLSQDQVGTFINDLKGQLEASRDIHDDLTTGTDDLVLKIHELRCKDWVIRQPLTATIDSTTLNSRPTTDRILERVQAGIARVLHGYGTTAELTAHKRGHLILETAVRQRDVARFHNLDLFASPDLKKAVLQERLRERIHEDISLIMKDTISLSDHDAIPKVHFSTQDASLVKPRTTQDSFKQDQMAGRKLLKKSALLNIRRRSLEEEAAATESTSHGELIDEYGFMADMVSERSGSLHIPTPSLADTASIDVRDGIHTPGSARLASFEYGDVGLGIMDFGDSNTETGSKSEEGIHESSRTVLHHPRPRGKNATALLASFWDSISSQQSRTGKSPTVSMNKKSTTPEGEPPTFGELEMPTTSERESPMTVEGERRTSEQLSTTTPVETPPMSPAWLMGTDGDSGAAEKGENSLQHKIDSSYETEAVWFANVVRKCESVTQQESTTPASPADNATLKPDSNTALTGKKTGQDAKNGKDTFTRMKFIRDQGNREGRRKLLNWSPSHPISNRSSSGNELRPQTLAVRDYASPLKLFPRAISGQPTPKPTMVHAEGRVHHRQISFPVGGHLGLHDNWSIEVGLRNALIPPHLRKPQQKMRLHSWPGRDTIEASAHENLRVD